MQNLIYFYKSKVASGIYIEINNSYMKRGTTEYIFKFYIRRTSESCNKK